MNRILLPLALLLAAAALAAGCRPVERGPVRVRIWHQKTGPERDLFDRIVARYNRAHPDRVVEPLYKETEELRSLYVIAAVGGQGPELVFGPADNVGLLALTQTIMPLDTVFAPEFYERFTPEGIVRWKDRTWLIADQIGNHLALVYNREMMPEVPESFDAFIEQAKRLTKDLDGNGTPDQYALTWNYTEPFFFVPFLAGFGGWVIDEEGNPTLDTPETVRAIQFVLDLRDRHRIIPRETDYETAETLFKEDRAATIINGSWAWAGYGDAGVDYMLARIPKIPETGRWAAPMVAAKGYSVNVNVDPEKLPVVREVLEYLTSAEVQAEMAEQLATIPVNRAVRASDVVRDNPVLQASIEQAEVGRPMPLDPQMRQIWDGMRGPYQLVMNGAVSAEEGARLMQQEAEKRIRDTFL